MVMVLAWLVLCVVTMTWANEVMLLHAARKAIASKAELCRSPSLGQQ
jgi:hypothetical protein